MTKSKIEKIFLPKDWEKYAPKNMTKKDFVSNLQWNLWRALRDYRQQQLGELYKHVREAEGKIDDPVQPGVAGVMRMLKDEYLAHIENQHKKELEAAKKGFISPRLDSYYTGDYSGKGTSSSTKYSDRQGDGSHAVKRMWTEDQAEASKPRKHAKKERQAVENDYPPPWRSGGSHRHS
jgi:hypothetical protein